MDGMSLKTGSSDRKASRIEFFCTLRVHLRFRNVLFTSFLRGSGVCREVISMPFFWYHSKAVSTPLCLATRHWQPVVSCECRVDLSVLAHKFEEGGDALREASRGTDKMPKEREKMAEDQCTTDKSKQSSAPEQVSTPCTRDT